MKRLILLLLLILFILPGCGVKKHYIEIPLPDGPPHPEEIRPTSPPPSDNLNL